MDENACSRIVIGAAIEVHRHLGPGLLESAYEEALAHELRLNKLKVLRQVFVPVQYKGLEINDAFRMDLLVEDLLVAEIKSVDKLSGIHEHQLHTYLRFSGKRVGLLLNFNSPSMRSGVKRVVNKL